MEKELNKIDKSLVRYAEQSWLRALVQLPLAKPTHCGLVGEIFKLPTAGSKMIYCTKHGYGINGIDLDRVDNTMNAVYCNKCPDRMLHPNDWNWTKKWQLEQNDKYGERFQH